MVSEAAAALLVLKKEGRKAGILMDGQKLEIGSMVDRPYERRAAGLQNDKDKLYIVGAGGSKKFFGLPDGRVVCLPNLEVNRCSSPEDAENVATWWSRVIEKETEFSEQITDAGLEAQHITKHNIEIGGYILPVMVAPGFELLLEEGRQVREVKGEHAAPGHSMIFGTPANIEDKNYLRKVVSGLIEDAIKAITGGFSFDMDACNIVIRDTTNTPQHDRHSVGLYSDRNQKIRFFFSDLTQSSYGKRFVDADGGVNEKLLRQEAKKYASLVILSVAKGVTYEEACHIVELADDNREADLYSSPVTLAGEIEKSLSQIENEIAEEIFSKTKQILEPPVHNKVPPFTAIDDAPLLINTGGEAKSDHIAR